MELIGREPKATIPIVAVVGTGVIGRSWVQVFARAGCQTRIHDRDPAQIERALAWLDQDLEAERAEALITTAEPETRRALVSVHAKLDDALAGAGYVQESGPEEIELKKDIYRSLDQAADPGTILGSSTSAHDMSEIAAGLSGARRCIVAHPVNPPHLIPVVEIVPGVHTDPSVVTRTRDFMTSVGQTPVVMNFYVPAFLLNRLQAALLREAISLVESGVADVAAVDTVVRDGLGLRWSLLGPFGVADTNADAGIREYFTRYGEAYQKCMQELGATPSFDAELIERLGQATDAMVGHAPRSETRRWRDRLIRKIRELKAKDPHPQGEQRQT
jgi:L-gulonate 3-dehydrogenase